MHSCSPDADTTAGRYDVALEFLNGRINYERDRAVPYRERELKLQRMKDLLARLGNPHQDVAIVHVAGTKGKGSTAAMLGAMLSAAGYRTGVFTSPHLDRVEERIAIDGRSCSAEDLAGLVDRVRPAVEAMDRSAGPGRDDEHGPTYFEILAAMAMLHFAQRGVQAAILEVGLGGRLDATNVCRPRVCAITSIGLDHTRQLGDTLASIAREKAGIVKPHVPLVSGVTQASPRAVIRGICCQREAPLTELGVDFHVRYGPPCRVEANSAVARFDFQSPIAYRQFNCQGVELGLLGQHQAANAGVALAVLGELEKDGWWIPLPAIRDGLARVDWPARVEVLSQRPTLVLDSAHNPSSIDALLQVLDESFTARRRLLVFSASRGKAIRTMLQRLVGRFDGIVFTQYQDNPRAVPVERLMETAGRLGLVGARACVTPKLAWSEIRAMAAPDDLICVTGSVFIAAEMRRQIRAFPLPKSTRA